MINKYKVYKIKKIIKENKFNGVVSIAHGSKLILSKGFGKANFEHDVSNTTKTRFRIASITKQFTASAILQLYDKGLINLEDTVDKYITDYPKGNKITIHHLLTHTSGISNFELEYDFYDVLHAESTLDALIDLFKYQPLQFEPGTQFSYSISGYLLLGYIIEDVTKMKYEDYLKKYIFEPLNMTNSGFDYHQDIVKRRANGYVIKDGVLKNADFIDMRIAGAGGGLYSNVEDLYIFNNALKSGKIISHNSVDLMFKNQFKIADGVHSGYGIFLQLGDLFGKNRHKQYHTGGGIGVRSINTFLPDDKLQIIMISNINDRDTFDTIKNEIERILLS